jgi:triacylglycerol lipase
MSAETSPERPTGADAPGIADTLADAVADVLPDAVTSSSFDPVPAPAPDEPAWWGRPLAEVRWQAELARLLVDPVFAGRGVPRGDGGPVLLIPGFLAGDTSLSVMSGWLRRIGHQPFAAGITANVDCSDKAVDRLERTLLRLHARTGRPVAIVGHSRGGHFAKALAARHPDGVRAVVSLGAGLDEPFDISLPTKAAVSMVRGVLRRVDPSTAGRGCLTTTCDCPFVRDYTAQFPSDVPITSVWSKGDGVVRWRSCVVPYARSVQVSGSHVGLAFNRHAYRAIAEALAP